MEKIIARPTIANIDITDANTEYSYTLPVGTTRFEMKLRNLGVPLKICFVSGGSGTNYINLPASQSYREDNIKKGSNILYFQAATAAQVAEIISWV
jgi:hypothetical protein